MFLQLDEKDPSRIAVIDDSGESLTYGSLCSYAEELRKVLPYRTLVFLMAENCIGSLIGYTSFLNNHVVPLILSNKTEKTLFDNLYTTYQPEYLWLPTSRTAEFGQELLYSAFGYSLIKTGNPTPELFEDLSLLLPTSGSTGSPKLVRHSYRNIEANAENLKNLFQITPSERAMGVLPMHYTMGLSVIASHLYAGATVLLCGKSLLDRGFWSMLKEQHATSFTGVPYSFELLSKLRFFRMDLPDLKIVTQGGGKLTEEMWQSLVDYAKDKGKKFIATYGQSECTARMAYLPAELAATKICSIGIAEPGGQLSIINHEGVETFEGEDSGEMVYRGENVTLGYAYSKEDLLKGDENHGIMHTGDLARRDADGCYYIIGRLKRFLKIFGLRIGLDEVENLIHSNYDTDCYCSGDDEKLLIKLTNPAVAEEIPHFIEEKTHLFYQRVNVEIVDKILRNETGKVINQ
jgi:acyl-coenzyme A synthetase/AMP-(fatty) acid ligase